MEFLASHIPHTSHEFVYIDTMSNISIHSLQPPSNGNDNHSASPIPVLLKLNQDILTHLKNSLINGNNVKLIVNQGNYVCISQHLIPYIKQTTNNSFTLVN